MAFHLRKHLAPELTRRRPRVRVLLRKPGDRLDRPLVRAERAHRLHGKRAQPLEDAPERPLAGDRWRPLDLVRVDCRRVEGLTGKRVVVTGGTSGIGEATSRRFLDEGARVAALAVGEEEIATAHERLPGLDAALRCDVADAQ